MKTLLKILAVAFTIGLTASAYAVPTLWITDGTNSVVISDQGAGDVSSVLGQVTWTGSIGNWNLNVDTGITYPALGTLVFPQLDLAFVAGSNGSGGTLWIEFSADGFGPSSGTSAASIGGTTDGTVAAWTGGGTSNALFDSSTVLEDFGTFGGPSFSGSLIGGVVTNAGPYSLTEVIKITHGGSAITSGDLKLSVPDGGATALLLGLGLLGVGVFARRRKGAKA